MTNEILNQVQLVWEGSHERSLLPGVGGATSYKISSDIDTRVMSEALQPGRGSWEHRLEKDLEN